MTTNARRLSRAAEVVLFVIGVLCLQWVAYVKIQTARQHAAVTQAVETAKTAEPPGEAAGPVPIETIAIGDPVGILSVPRLKLSTAVVEGDSDEVLETSAGHLPDTPWPWQPGNAAIAAHRDGLFRELRHVKVGDVIEMKTARGDFQYRIAALSIVSPTDVSVLDETEQPSLTLITCYPFYYVGHAPKRFIVRAERTTPPSPVLE